MFELFSRYELLIPRLWDIHPAIWLPLALLLGLTALLALFNDVPIAYVVGNLAVRWKTMALTVLTFSLVVGLLIGMLAFVNGLYALTKASGHPENVIILSEGSTDEGFSNLGFSDVSDIENQPGIVREDDKPLVSRETLQLVNQQIENPQPGRPKRRFIQIRGIDEPVISSRVHQLPLHEGGRWFSEAGVNDDSDIEVVLGEGIARELSRDRTPEANFAAKNRERLETGDTFNLNNRVWRVVGVMKSSGSTFDSEIWAKRSLVGAMFGKETYTTLVARAPTGEEAVRLRDFFNKEYTKASLAAQVETDYFAKLGESNKVLLYAITFVTFFMSVGGMFGVMNTMFAAISQRIKDIGVLRLLGFGRNQILGTFLLESLLISAIGGIAGCLCGSLSDGVTANSIVSAGPGGGGKFVVLAFTVDAQTLAAGMLLSLFMGLAGGFLPSMQAMRTTPLESLR